MLVYKDQPKKRIIVSVLTHFHDSYKNLQKQLYAIKKNLEITRNEMLT